MAITRNLMEEAIEQGNLNAVQQIIADRDARGIPRINLNSQYGNAASALMWALWRDPINKQIIQVLLDARDNAGNPVVDINRRGPHGQTVYSFILSTEIPESLRRKLLQSFLDVRGPNGELIADLREDQCQVPLLQQALRLNDIHCLRILLDARLANGEKALNVNTVHHGKTVLDFALSTNDSWYRFNQDVVNAIQQAGGLRARDLPRQRQIVMTALRQAEPEPQVINQPVVVPVAAIDAEQRFNQDAQNIHDPSVTQTVKGSLQTLNRLYGDNLEEDKAITEITRLVENFNYSKLIIDISLSNAQKKQTALDVLSYIMQRSNFLHSHTDFSFKKIYSLIWKAVVDDNLDMYPEDIRRTIDPTLKKAPSYLVETKMSSLVEKFIETHRIYRVDRGIERDICDGGAIHKLLEALNRAHTGVIICTGSLSVKPTANEVPKSTLKQMLREMPVREQRKILSTWHDGEENSAAAQFRKLSVDIIESTLTRQFGTLLTKRDRDEITGQYEYFPMPIMHNELQKLIDEIKAIPDCVNNDRQSIIARIKDQATHAYDESDRTLQEEYQLLSEAYSNFKTYPNSNQLDEYMTFNFQQAFDKLNLEKCFFNKLNALILKINNLNEDENNPFFNQCLEDLKRETKNSISLEGSFEKKYNVLLYHFQTFYLSKSINKMKEYGDMLHHKGSEKKGTMVIELAANLNTKMNDFFGRDRTENEFQKFKQAFLVLLNSKNKEMAQYRIAWKPILKNIAIAVTGIGLLLIGAKLTHSKVTKGRALFFFQKKQTLREEKIQIVKRSLNRGNSDR